jgi:Lrp/AsnC family leucine-responsive transcriptional regulator
MLDDIDRKLLRALQRDGRTPNKALAGQIGLSPSACLARLRRLEREGVVQGYTTILAKRVMGPHIEALVTIALERRANEDRAILLDFLRRRDDVLAAYEVTAPFDVAAQIVVRDFETWTAFEVKLHATVKLGEVRFCPIVGVVKPPSPWPLPPPAET